jgi:hypothetical protein
MRAKEFIVEHAAPLTRGSYTIQVDSHAFQRVKQRNINPHSIDQLLNTVTSIKPKFKKFAAGQRFWLHSQELNISIGLTMVDPEQRILRLKTVIEGHPWADLVPTIRVA